MTLKEYLKKNTLDNTIIFFPKSFSSLKRGRSQITVPINMVKSTGWNVSLLGVNSAFCFASGKAKDNSLHKALERDS